LRPSVVGQVMFGHCGHQRRDWSSHTSPTMISSKYEHVIHVWSSSLMPQNILCVLHPPSSWWLRPQNAYNIIVWYKCYNFVSM
jgi:hypothetical protein